jgi:hypothetical protein
MVVAPIAASIAAMRDDGHDFAPALMLGTAFAATIGGIGSLIGTPPNALFAAYMAEDPRRRHRLCGMDGWSACPSSPSCCRCLAGADALAFRLNRATWRPASPGLAPCRRANAASPPCPA